MIEVLFYRKESGALKGFQISGHAGYGESGNDIVCAAVSALSENLVNSVEAFTGDKPESLAVNEEEGFLHFTLSEVSTETELLLKSFRLGIEIIQKEYPEYLQIRYVEESTC